jgi:biotin transport system substrate-specific component
MSFDQQQTLREWALQPVVDTGRARTVLGILIFVVATALGAWVAVPVPFTAVPMTLQPLFVILAGALLGPWAGAASMATYLAVGAAGAPVFSMGGAGLPWLLGPTGGYLLAYPAAAFAVGMLAGRSRSWVRLAGALSCGLLLIYAGGVSQLFILTGEDLPTLLALGVVPFLVGDALKILMALVITRSRRVVG